MEKKEEIYITYKRTGTEPPVEEIRSADELTTDEYYEFVEDDRIVPKEEKRIKKIFIVIIPAKA